MSVLYSVVVPVHNEIGAAADLAREIDGVFSKAYAPDSYEIIFVDDCSRDGTRDSLIAAKADVGALRVLSHERNSGQSRAVRTGVLAAQGEFILTLDGDGQNPPADGPKLIDALKASGPEVVMAAGQRLKRQDTAAKKWASKWANAIRKSLLNDGADDTGCGLKAFRRAAYLRLPYFDHMHRYLPALVRREGLETIFLDVNHRARTTGQSKYTNLGRIYVALSDLLGVMWLNRRSRLPGRTPEH